MSNTSRIAKNTIALYFRQILIMLVSLYTVRVVLNTLGVQDYGIYNVVAGVVSLLSFLSNSMSTASQRFFSYDLGTMDYEHLKKMFSISVEIYAVISVFVIILAETVGVWFVNAKLLIPAERMLVTNWIYQFSVISFVFTIMTSPFMAAIIAHEEMNIYAIVSIVEVFLKVGIVFLLRLFSIDKLWLYGLLMLCVTIINTTIYRTICRVKFKECRFRFFWNKTWAKEMFGFTFWNLLGCISSVARNQGINIVLNLFFSPVVNAARGIAYQVNNAILSFSNNFSTALRPQIIKCYAKEDFDTYKKMVFYGSKMTFYLMSLISVPLIYESPYVLSFWLKNVPEYTVLFVQLVLIDSLIDSVSLPFMSSVQATGKIALYQVVVGGLLIFNLPVSYIFLRIGFPPETTMIVAIFISLVALFLRVFLVEFQVHLRFTEFLYRNLPIMFGLSAFSYFALLGFQKYISIQNDFFHLIASLLFSSILQGILILFVGMRKDEREKFLKNWRKRK